MNLLTAITELISVFLLTTPSVFATRKVAKEIELVNRPNYRRQHRGLIPLVGDVSVYADVCFTFTITDYYIPHASLYPTCARVLVLVSTPDDRFDISAKVHAVVQATTAVTMMMTENLYLGGLGFIFDSWELVLEPLSFFLTLFAVQTAINASNMVDRIDDLSDDLSSAPFAATRIILWFGDQYNLVVWCFVMIIAILPRILLNLDALGCRYKAFVGDAGSTVINFTIIWILLETT